ncbi:alanine racemase [Azospirillum picis]|uniref:Alanine racemase n=1 Tax=Azospirillum picis TaxID=488438 RepID=A0ABU0MNN7_9PROT|nr:alanine racemase [Azospirillum picis]MBP2301260.1 alanine racemase [Azospirillum picis]MDQ0535091.1 alanine racemase [Azospirillum picis]
MSATDPSASAGAILTVDVGAVVANWMQLRDRVAPAECSAVVKADAYGLGAARIVPALAAAGCRSFFVAQFSEALAVRRALDGTGGTVAAQAEVASLGGLPAGCEADFLAARILPVLNHAGEIAAWSAFARSRGERLPAIIHIDTGMNRLGLGPDELDDLAGHPERLDGIDVRYWMTHLACADEFDNPMTGAQRERFRAALARLPKARASFANSSGIFHGRDHHFDLARPGCALYGINPTPHLPNPMGGVMRLDARILQVRDCAPPMTVGYGAAHAVAGPARIATIGVGYADGYLRTLGGKGHVHVDGTPAPIVGRISMDLITIDVTGLPEPAARPGRMVELIGPSRPVDQVAAEAGTIGYEILTSLGRRYHRVHTGA